MIPFILTLFRFVNSTLRSLRDPEFQALSSLVAMTLLSGTLFYRGVEGWSFLDSLYFCVATLTTVGYGDFYPTTPYGKIFTIFYLFVGIGLIAAFIGKVATEAMKPTRRNLQEPPNEETSAPRE